MEPDSSKDIESKSPATTSDLWLALALLVGIAVAATLSYFVASPG